MSTTEFKQSGGAPAGEDLPPLRSGISIIVCTYNRLELLTKFVDSVLPQLPAAYPLEILIVDNNSTDGTAAYARRLVSQHPSFSYFHEKKQGLSHARNGGAEIAKFEFLLYCDDDSFLPPDFLTTIGAVVAENDPDLFGGPCLPHYVDPRPSWFPEWLEVRKKAATSGFSSNATLSGSNFGIRRDVLRRLGGFNPQFGMIGKRPGMLEERLVMESYRRTTPAQVQKVYYCVEAFVYHHTPASRMRFGFQVRRIYQANFSFAHYMLGQGARTPRLFRDRAGIRLLKEAGRFLGLLPALWRERETHPDRAMSEFIRLVYRVGDFNGAMAALRDAARSERKSKKKKKKKKNEGARARENRPLQIMALVSDPPETNERQRRVLHAILEHLQTVSVLRIQSIIGMTGEEIHALNWELDSHNLDVILTDTPSVAFALRDLRTSAPQIQIILWAREPKPFMAMYAPWRLLRHPIRLQRQIERLRKAARNVDQVIWSVSRRARLAPLLLGARDLVFVPNAPKGSVVAPPACVKGWAKVLRKAAIWAPVRNFGTPPLPLARGLHTVQSVGLFVNAIDSDDTQMLDRLIETLGVQPPVDCHAAAGLSGTQVRDLVDAMDPDSVGTIITDSPDVALALRPLQESAPHSQIVLWARDPQQFAALLRPWGFWRNPFELKRHLSRLRLAASIVDQMVWSIRNEGLARFVLASSHWTHQPLNQPPTRPATAPQAT